MSDSPKPLRGFAWMHANEPSRAAQLAKLGGASVKPENRAFSRDKDLAREAGRKGGQASRGGGRPRSA